MGDDSEHDPFNEPGHRHPRANALLPAIVWDCVNEDAPFGSDEGWDAYYEFRDWRVRHPKAPLTECLAWIGKEVDYPDAFTFDTTVIATVLGQFVDEGRIDADAKPFALRAIERRAADVNDGRTESFRIPSEEAEAERQEILRQLAQVIAIG